MNLGDADSNPYAQPAQASVAPPPRNLRPDERQYLLQLRTFRQGIPPVSSSLIALFSQSVWTFVAAGVGAAAIGTAIGVLIDLTPGQLLAILLVLFLCIQGGNIYHELSSLRRSYALWDIASHVLDYSKVERALATGQLPREGDEMSTKGDEDSIAS